MRKTEKEQVEMLLLEYSLFIGTK